MLTEGAFGPWKNDDSASLTHCAVELCEEAQDRFSKNVLQAEADHTSRVKRARTVVSRPIENGTSSAYTATVKLMPKPEWAAAGVSRSLLLSPENPLPEAAKC